MGYQFSLNMWMILFIVVDDISMAFSPISSRVNSKIHGSEVAAPPMDHTLPCHVSFMRVTRTIASDGRAKRSSSLQVTKEKNFLMDEFTTADGYIINPYETLNVHRNSSREGIKIAYRTLCKRYHPDAWNDEMTINGAICNEDELRNEWERIKFAYEILSDKRTKMKYDRHKALNDNFSQTLGKAAVSLLSWGATEITKGIVKITEQVSGESEASASTKITEQVSGESKASTLTTINSFKNENVINGKNGNETAPFTSIEKNYISETKQQAPPKNDSGKITLETKLVSACHLFVEQKQLEKETEILEEARVAIEGKKTIDRIEKESNIIEEMRFRKAKKQQEIASNILKSVVAQEIKRKRENM